jgi:hypothetical protein
MTCACLLEYLLVLILATEFYKVQNTNLLRSIPRHQEVAAHVRQPISGLSLVTNLVLRAVAMRFKLNVVSHMANVCRLVVIRRTIRG